MSRFQYRGFDLTDRVAVITGAGTGIGKAIALGMAEAGAHIVLFGRRGKPLNEVAKKVRALGREALCFSVDVRDVPQVRKCVRQSAKEFGKIDILVNNAAVAIHEPLERATLRTWDETMETNLKGAFFCAHAVGQVMIRQKRGKIINILSNCSFVAETGIGIYCASKGGLLMLTRCLATEWGKYGIHVNGIGPAFILTPMNEPLLKDKHFVEWSTNRIPFHRMGRPEEVADVIVWLCSQKASYVTGQVIHVNGGLYM